MRLFYKTTIELSDYDLNLWQKNVGFFPLLSKHLFSNEFVLFSSFSEIHTCVSRTHKQNKILHVDKTNSVFNIF